VEKTAEMTTVTVTKSHFEKLSIRRLLNTIFDHMKQENFGFTSFLSYNMKKTHFMTLKSPFMTNK
jgi:hypothetical protein